jgi:hypothetical protein
VAEYVKPLTTEEKHDIQNDPAVQQVMSLFGGTLTDIRRDSPPPAPAASPTGPGPLDPDTIDSDPDDLDDDLDDEED